MSILKIEPEPFTTDEKLFEPPSRGTSLTRLLAELEMLLKGGKDGGLHIMMGRKAATDRVGACSAFGLGDRPNRERCERGLR